MAESATERLDRVLYVLPLAVRKGGASLDELAQALSCDRAQVLRDLGEVTARSYYHAPGAADQLQILLDGDHVDVWTPAEFQQPPRLTPREGLALELGLRVLAAESPAERRAAVLSLAQRLERALVASIEDLGPPVEDPVALDVGEDGFRAELVDAIEERLRCRILYLKPGDDAPARRDVDPYLLVHASGAWYLLARDATSEDIRAFRMDRMLSVEVSDLTFAAPAGFAVSDWVSEHRVYRAPAEETLATVRYAPRIARWIRERYPCELVEDGAVLVRHRVADPTWIVRHVLQYGTDAQVLEPASLRERVAQTARRMTA